MASLWSVLHVALWLVLASAATAAPDAANAQILRALEGVILEEDASKILEPHMENLRTLDAAVIEKVVFKHWWHLAQDMVARSHKQKADLSVAVRKAVRTLKDDADELVRTLNPKYGQAQSVAPAFQWAQNDTCIFLTVKFTVRWNAPGALGVSESAVHMETNKFNFTGLGKHSNNKYKYQLAFKMFDNISPVDSTWDSGSVGKLSVTLRKKWARKWPRLLQDKKTKIGNMHVWMETQDRLNGQLAGMSTVTHSPVTCRDLKKLYCSVTDTCKMATNCSTCPGKTEADEDQAICAGVPTQKPSISFTDTDMDRDQLGGRIKFFKEKYDFESETFSVYWGRDESNKIDSDEAAASQGSFIGEVDAQAWEPHVSIPSNTKKPEHASHLLAFSKNKYGEYSTPQALPVKDACLPLQSAQSVTFEDEDGDRNEVKGYVTVVKPEDDSTIDKYAVYWGKSATQRVDRRKNHTAFIQDVSKTSHQYWIGDSTRIPDQATHILAYAKNEFGEHPTPVAVKIVDSMYPCQKMGDDDCASGVSRISSEDSTTTTLSIGRAKSEAGLTGYSLSWGRSACDEDGPGIRNGHIKDMSHGTDFELQVDAPIHYQLSETFNVPDGTTHILAFSKNKHGESKFCVSQLFVSDSSTGAADSPGAEEASPVGDKPEL